MNGTRQARDKPVPSDKVRVQAATWIARLHDERRSPDLEAKLRAWLGESEDHRRAFDRLIRVWERAGEIRTRPRRDAGTSRADRRWQIMPWAASLAVTLVLAVGAAVYVWRDDVIVTGIGQQHVQWLRDGTRVLLNTDTRIEVIYDESARRVRLIRGEAWFDVAHRATWPFLVSVGNQEIRALGTSFIVRRDDNQGLSVTLVEGQVSVVPYSVSRAVKSEHPIILAPGQRLTVSQDEAPAIDNPELTRITAWRHGRVDFQDTPLGDAATEMNRYSKTHIAVVDASIAKLRIGGVFRAGDSDDFVKVVSTALGLRADHRGGDVVLARPAGAPPLP